MVVKYCIDPCELSDPPYACCKMCKNLHRCESKCCHKVSLPALPCTHERNTQKEAQEFLND